jgi:DNA-binding MarR family transcriptional regulator
MERDGHLHSAPDGRDRRSRLITMTPDGRRVWMVEVQPKIRSYYAKALADFSMSDMTHTLHYLLKILDNMERLDLESGASDPDVASVD